MFAAEFFPVHESITVGTRVVVGGGGLRLGPWEVVAREVANVEVEEESVEGEEGGEEGEEEEGEESGGGEGGCRGANGGQEPKRRRRRRRLLETEPAPLDVWAVLRNEIVYHLPMPAPAGTSGDGGGDGCVEAGAYTRPLLSST